MPTEFPEKRVGNTRPTICEVVFLAAKFSAFENRPMHSSSAVSGAGIRLVLKNARVSGIAAVKLRGSPMLADISVPTDFDERVGDLA